MRAEDLRRSIEARLMATGLERGVDVNRLRRQLVFQRLVRRLAADGGWVLKGGFALEARLPDRARATQDVDVALRQHSDDVHDHLATALDTDPDGDGFAFVVTLPSGHRRRVPDGRALRFHVQARLAGRTFQRLRLDAGLPSDELDGGVEDLAMAPVLGGLAWPIVVVPAVDVAQHAAEKLHAITRTHGEAGLASTRVKDLVDLVLLLEAGLLPDPRLADRLRHVFGVREEVAPPESIGPGGAAWAREFAAFAAELGLAARDLDDAVGQVNAVLRQALAEPAHHERRPSMDRTKLDSEEAPR